MTGYCYSAVHEALCRLRAAGFLQWIRRSRKTDNDGAGPQVEQISNAYSLLVPKPLERLVQLIFGKTPMPDCERAHRERHKRDFKEMLAAVSAREFVDAIWDGDRTAGEALKRIGELIERREALVRGSSTARETGGSKDP
jgi:hypothetical protein